MSTSAEEYKEGASISNDDVCEVNDMLKKLSTVDVTVCANCGKEGEDVNNICNKCKQTTYCNAVCKKVHKKKHKKDCEEHIRLATENHNEELRIATELHDIELFKQPLPTDEDCPICFLRMPIRNMGLYKACCGKVICSGCCYAPVYDNQGNEVDNNKCPFCRTPTPSSHEELVERLKKRMETGDPLAIYTLAVYYRDGANGLPQADAKALELFYRAAELGYAAGYNSTGFAYEKGNGVGVDKKKATHYFELAAMKGDVCARYNLGIMEKKAGNMDRAVKHFMIAVQCGDDESLKKIHESYSNEHATKDDYTTALQSYQAFLSEIKSDQRDKAAVADKKCRYY